jgi:hypothetical protein
VSEQRATGWVVLLRKLETRELVRVLDELLGELASRSVELPPGGGQTWRELLYHLAQLCAEARAILPRRRP